MRLLKDRTLNVAILVSTSWHLICMFSISPIFISGNIKENSTTISFLGSIMEKVIRVQEKPFGPDRVSLIKKIHRIKDNNSKGAISLMPPEIASKALFSHPDKEKFTFSGNKYKKNLFKMHHTKMERPRIKFKDILVTGEARNRILLYKPELSGAFIFSSQFNSDYNVSVRFKISRHGFVERPECIVSSGSSEIDREAVKYIRKWQFVPYYGGLEDVQEGVARVNFDAL